jgi:hypothetical protein
MGAKPSKEMAICFVVFNPAQTKRILMNYYYSRSQFELQQLPVYTIELVYEGRKPEIPDAIHVHTSSYMFHKENLYRVLFQHLPKQYKKLAFLDADVFFKDPSWYDQTSKLLDTFDIVQPYETAHWLDLTYTETQLSRKTVLLMPTKKWSFEYHPGFAWCMRRKWYKHNGFFEYAISGSADTLSCAAWLKKEFPKGFQSLPKAIRPAYEDYKEKLKEPKMTYVADMDIYHLYHGSRVNRKYADRHKMIDIDADIRNLTLKNEEGVLEWKEPAIWNELFYTYFKERHDDDLSQENEDKKKEVVKVTKTS